MLCVLPWLQGAWQLLLYFECQQNRLQTLPSKFLTYYLFLLAFTTYLLLLTFYLDLAFALAKTDLDFNTGSQVQLHQGFDELFSWLDDVQQTLVGTNFVLVTRILINMW